MSSGFVETWAAQMLPGGHLGQSGQYCSQLSWVPLPATPVPRELEKGPSGVWQLLRPALESPFRLRAPRQPALSPASRWRSLPAPWA